MDTAEILLRTPIFHDVARADIEQLVPDVRERVYDRGQSVWVEGDPAEALLIVAEGQLKSHRVSPDGREVILGLDTAVAVAGEVGLLHPRGVRWVSVSAMSLTRCLTIARAPLLMFLSRNPVAMRRMLEQLAMRAVEAAESFSGLAFHPIGRRVASLLVLLAREQGEETPDGLRIQARLSQGELAARVAASRENVNRALSTLVSRGVVSQRTGHFYVHDCAALERAAAGGEDFA